MNTSSEAGGPPLRPVTVLVVDGHAAIRDALAAMLAMEPGIAVVGTAATVGTALALIRRRRPDVTLLDLGVLERRDWTRLRNLGVAGPRAAVLVMGVVDNPAVAHTAVRHGAAGRVLKDAPAHEIVTAIRRAAQGSARLRLLPPDS